MIEAFKDKIIFKTVKDQFKKIPFHNLMGINITKFRFESAKIIISRNEKLVGNVVQGSLHGGVTATLLDSIGGLVAIGNFLAREKDQHPQYLKECISKMGTIDLRIDYLLPGKGKKFSATVRVIRGGKRVTVCRVEVHNNQNKCIDLGTGTYLWSK
ncbi:MAG: hypothetical protein CMG74_05745 [Candidatus Marinimicrobia bacterium]|nr:hypothetical protein [Candidatus Neomarinimicrobiota bacterium]|tara:strand:- start:183 stop:650 length:468 start_codon:yes stop_codon:yes gene_type:complete